MKKIVALLITLAVHLCSDGQSAHTDTIKIFNYNTNNYGIEPAKNYPEISTQKKHQYLRTIIKYCNPDIIGLTKMNSSPSSFGKDTVVDKVLDKVCKGCWKATSYTNQSGYSKENMIYYKKSKLGYISTSTIFSEDKNISDINMHKLYYRSNRLAITHDTIFLYVVLAHLKSGDDNAKKRGKEIDGAMTWLKMHVSAPGNYIFMGDFNTQSSNEKCFQELINTPDSDIKFFDPPDKLGDWTDHPSKFAMYLTESTRGKDLGDGGSNRSMNFRFDHILCTSPIMNGTLKLMYVPGSFKVIGQDGLHTNKAIVDLPKNNSVPPDVLNALYYMSEHLPVEIKLKVIVK